MSNTIPTLCYEGRTGPSLKRIMTGRSRFMRSASLAVLVAFGCLNARAQEIASVSYIGVNSAFEGQSQAKSLKSVLTEIETQFDVNILYEDKIVNKKFVKAASVAQGTIDELLKDILKPLGLSFKKISEGNYVIKKAKKSKKGINKLSQKPFNNAQSGVERASLTTLPSKGSSMLSKADEVSISGKVTSEEGEPLPGVSVLVKGTTIGTVTDVDGNYRLEVPDESEILVFSFVGYTAEEVSIEGRSVIDMVMVPDIETLSEVVVVGYGTQVKRDVTGAISTVKAKDLETFKAPSLDQKLQGQASGVQVSSQSGVPGAPVRVMIRGTNSLFSGTEPLWIIDGMILSDQGGGELGGFGRSTGTTPLNPLATLNPNDIESMEVLKDAAATAIYGSRGANGVIIITTKSGKQGKGTLDVGLNYGITDVVRGPEELGFVDGPTWLSLADQARANRGQPPFQPNDILDADRDPNAMLDRSQIANTNWFDEILRQGHFMEFNLSTSRGFEGGNYFISGQYREDESILVSNRLQRGSLRANVDFTPANNLTIGTRLSLSFTNNERAPNGGAPTGNSNMATGGYNMANTGAIPILPIIHPTALDFRGDPLLFDPLSGRNIAASLNRDNYINDTESFRAIGGLNIEYKLPWVSGLSLRSELSFDYVHTNGIEWGNTVIRENSKYAFDFGTTFRRYNYNLYATYNKTFLQDHNINFVAGAESTGQDSRGKNIEAQEIFGDAQELGGPGDILRASAGFGAERFFRGFFGRLNYKYLDRYLFGFSYRRDGVSVFTPENRWGDYLAFSAGWILTEESFFRNLGPVSFMKLRASYGQTGNSAVPATATETVYATWGRYGDVGAGDLLRGIGNPNITWETTDSYDVGVDFELFESRISGSVGYYRQEVRNMLFQVDVPASSGIFDNNPTIWQNVGDMRNQGFEFSVSSTNIDKQGFTWKTNFNFTTNSNEILALANDDNEEIYNANRSPLVSRVGESIGYFRLADYAGINTEGGYEMIYEMDLDFFEQTGIRRRTGNVIPATRANLEDHLFDFTDKSGLPTFFGGITNNFAYKGLELSVLFTFQGGNYIFDRAERNASIVNGAKNFRQDIVGNTWTPENRDAPYPALSWNNQYDVINEDGSVTPNVRFDGRGNGRVHDRFLYKGDFLRLRTLQVAYNLPSHLTEKLSMRNVRVYVSADNLLTITGYDGYDPETFGLGNNQQRNLGQGFVDVQLPQVRSWNFGVNFSF